MTRPNIPLLRKVVEWVEEQEQLDMAQPERTWYQDYWFAEKAELFYDENEGWCGTAMCVAGKIATDAGWKRKSNSTINVWKLIDGEPVIEPVNIVAGELLGLDLSTFDDDGNGDEDLFDSDLTAADIRRIAERIAGEKL